MKRKILFIYGTRPEAVKMAPLIQELRKRSEAFEVQVCLTGQHRHMLDQVNSFFGISGDHDLNIMSPNQTLFDITSRALIGIGEVLAKVNPDLVFVQGDTTTVLAGALAAYYRQIKVAHLEAGLRSGNKYSPFPEEINRSLTGRIADFHFAPTPMALANLNREHVGGKTWVVGNTVVDALLLGLDIIKKTGFEESILEFLSIQIPAFRILHQRVLDGRARVVLVTGHRRESFGKPFENICDAMLRIVDNYTDVELVYPVHLNPNVRGVVTSRLGSSTRIHLVEPLDYPYLIWFESFCTFILTDSGGIQEEGPTLGKPVLVMRDVTERIEGIESGTALLVGTDSDRIFTEASRLLNDHEHYMRMSMATNPYGDGTTSRQIAQILEDERTWE